MQDEQMAEVSYGARSYPRVSVNNCIYHTSHLRHTFDNLKRYRRGYLHFYQCHSHPLRNTHRYSPRPRTRILRLDTSVITGSICRTGMSCGGIHQGANSTSVVLYIESPALICTPVLLRRWESYPREFAKCQRYRKAKYYGKE
jgi:hypothetical protein